MPTDALITQSLPALINGVSQQPPQQRLVSQVEAQDNFLSEVSVGVTDRPPTEHVALLTGAVTSVPTGGFKVHVIDRGDGEQFGVFLEDGDVNVYNLSTGAEVTVNNNGATQTSPPAYDYLDFDTGTYTAEEAFAVVTIADYTFIVNKTIAAAMSGVTSAARDNAHEFLIYAKEGGLDGNTNIIRINIGGTAVTPGAAGTVAAEAMIDALATALCGTANPSDTAGTAGGSVNDWRFTRVTTSLLHGYQALNLGALDVVTTTDEYSDTLHELLTTDTNGGAPQVARFSDLPAKAKDNFTVKVKGTDGSQEDEFYVVWDDDENIWKETVNTGLDDNFDADTMPHALVYDAVANDFDFQPITWAARLAGDATSAPEPSFIGKTIKDVVLNKNRLVLIADENAIASESGEFFNFWPTTVTTLVDSDPFDVAGTGARVSIWDYAIPYRGGLTLFSTVGDIVGELVGSRDEPLTIKNARVEERAAYASSDVRPIALGEGIYFALDRGGATSLFLYQQADVDVWAADEITGHVPTYVPPNIVRMSAGAAENLLCLLSSETNEDHRIYIYRYHTVGNEQVMSAWSRWDFETGDQVLSADFIGSILYLFVSRQDGIHLEKMDFGKLEEDSTLGHRVHLDGLVSLTGTYSGPNDETTWTIPYDQATNGGTYHIVKGGAWGSEAGTEIVVKDASVDLSITAAGDHSANAVYIGREYERSVEVSELFLRDEKSRRASGRGRLAGRLQLRKGRVVYEDTGTFDVQIQSRQDSDIYTQVMSNQTVNQTLFGTTGLASGVFDFHIGGDSSDIRIIFRTTSWLPASLAAVEWEGRYFQRSDQA